MKKISVLVITLITAVLFSVGAAAMAVPAAPNTETDFYVADYAGVLSDDTKASIVSANQTLRSETGAEIVVVTVDFTDGTDTDEYAYEIGNGWGVGSSEYNNGVVLLLSIGDDDYFCAVGTGLNDFSGKVKTILNTDLEPDFAAKDYNAGVAKCFASLVTMVRESGVGGELKYYADSGDYTFTGYRSNASGGMSDIVAGTATVVFAVMFFVFVIIFVMSLARSASRRGGNVRFPFMSFLFMNSMFRGPRYHHHHHHHHDDHHNHFGGFGGHGGFGGGGGFSGGGGFGGHGGFSGGGAGRH